MANTCSKTPTSHPDRSSGRSMNRIHLLLLLTIYKFKTAPRNKSKLATNRLIWRSVTRHTQPQNPEELAQVWLKPTPMFFLAKRLDRQPTTKTEIIALKLFTAAGWQVNHPIHPAGYKSACQQSDAPCRIDDNPTCVPGIYYPLLHNDLNTRYIHAYIHTISQGNFALLTIEIHVAYYSTLFRILQRRNGY